MTRVFLSDNPIQMARLETQEAGKSRTRQCPRYTKQNISWNQSEDRTHAYGFLILLATPTSSYVSHLFRLLSHACIKWPRPASTLRLLGRLLMTDFGRFGSNFWKGFRGTYWSEPGSSGMHW